MAQGNDRYQKIAGQFNEYLKDFFAPSLNHTTYHFGYKPVIDIIKNVSEFPNISVLDYGSGAGQFCAYLSEMNVNTLGVEPSVPMLSTARKNFPALLKSFVQPEELSSDHQNSFDICTMNFVTCELQNEQEVNTVISNAFKFLKSEGKLVILTNNPEANPEGSNFNIWSVGAANIDIEGSPVKITIHTEETSFEMIDYFWSRKFIENKLQALGFDQINSFSPSIEILEKEIWKDEIKYSPTLIYTAVKP